MNAEAKFVSSVMDARLKKVRKERDSFRKQRDELIEDMAEVKRKAKILDEILSVSKYQHEEEYADEVLEIINKYEEEQ